MLFDKLNSPGVEVKKVYLVNEESVMIHYKDQEDFIPVSKFTVLFLFYHLFYHLFYGLFYHQFTVIPLQESDKTNVVIAAFTSCMARLKLFSVLKKLGRRTLYTDTDSVSNICHLL